jgi:hypothetical protein
MCVFRNATEPCHYLLLDYAHTRFTNLSSIWQLKMIDSSLSVSVLFLVVFPNHFLVLVTYVKNQSNQVCDFQLLIFGLIDYYRVISKY